VTRLSLPFPFRPRPLSPLLTQSHDDRIEATAQRVRREWQQVMAAINPPASTAGTAGSVRPSAMQGVSSLDITAALLEFQGPLLELLEAIGLPARTPAPPPPPAPAPALPQHASMRASLPAANGAMDGLGTGLTNSR